MDRREFLQGAAKTALVMGLASRVVGIQADEERSPKMNTESPKKALILSMLPDKLSMGDRFKLAADLGFQGMEVGPTNDPHEIRILRGASEKAGIPIHSIIYGGWGGPLSTADPAAGAQAVEAAKLALQSAKELGATGLLLVPGVVNPDTRYVDAYNRSQKRVKELIPTAEKTGVTICIENVWNHFLLSPMEFARYIDEINSPFVQAYFDVGNVIGAFGFSQDWILTLGKRIKKMHLKDFKLSDRSWQNLGDGSVDWPAVKQALHDIGYTGFMTTELGGGDERYLGDLSKRIDKLLLGG